MKRLSVLFLALPLLAIFSHLASRSSGVGNILGLDETGGPVSSGTCGGCHSGGGFNPAATFSITDQGGNPVNSWVAGTVYNIQVQVSSSVGTPVGFGTQLVALRAGNANAGSLANPGPSTRITNLVGRQYMENSAINASGIFTAQWTAPNSGVGTVTFYFIGLAANGNGGTTGDRATPGLSFALPEQCVPVTNTQNRSICSGNSYTIGNNTYTSSGTYVDTLTAASGCDSIVTTQLTVTPAIQFTQNPVICQGQSITVGIHTYNQTGTYTDSLSTPSGCDSIVTTHLTVNSISLTNQILNICQGQSLNVGIHTYSVSGNYTDTLNAANGCDSIIFTNLTVLAPTTFSQNIQICQGASYTIGSNTYSSNGNYLDTLSSAAGCDSIVSTQLSVVSSIQVTQNGVICPGSGIQVGPNFYTLPGTYVDTLSAAAGCDSIVTSNLSAGSPTDSLLITSICQGDTFFAGGQFYLLAGNYSDTLQNASGCDSILNIQLSLNPLPAVSIQVPLPPYCVDMNSVQLNATPTGGTFSGTAVNGNIFNPSQAGIGMHPVYYSLSDSNGCSATDTVVLEVVICSGFASQDANQIPVQIRFLNGECEISGLEKGMTIALADLNGKILYQAIAENEIEVLPADQFPAIVLIRIEGNGKIFCARYRPLR